MGHTLVQVESLQYDTIFKKAFRQVDLFTGLVEDFTGIHLEIDEVEKEKVFEPPIGQVKIRFDLFAEDKKNRVIVEAQHATSQDDFDRFFYYHAIAMAETIHNSKDYRFPKVIMTLVFFTEKKTPKPDNNILVQDLEIRTLKGEIVPNARGLKHQILFIFTGDPISDLEVPEPCLEWIKAIHDTMDEQADENKYENPLIKQLFQIISKDQTSPDEYAQMKEEYNQQQALKNAFEEGQGKGERKAKLEAARQLKALGKLTEAEIANAIGLTLKEVQAL